MSEILHPDINELDGIGLGPDCPKCGMSTAWVRCWDCGGEGCYDGYEEDPLYYDEGDMIPCGNCNSRGGWFYCVNCG